MRLLLLLVVVLPSLTPQAEGRTYSLADALREARMNAPEVRELRATTAQALQKAEAIEGAFDSTLFAETQWTTDKSPSLQPTSGERRLIRQSKLGWRRLFATGSHLELALESQRQEFFYPEPSVPAADPQNPQIPQSSQAAISSELDPNPNYQNQASLTLSQPLWRNFMAEEVTLRKKAALRHAIAPNYAMLVFEQAVQAEAEQLFWTLKKLNEQKVIARKIVAKSKSFASLMKKRIGLGRADDVDVAGAESQLVEAEGNLLNLEIAADETRMKLAYRMNPISPDHNLKISGVMNRATLLLRDRSEAYLKAQQQRLDLRQITEEIPAVQSEIDLAREQGRPQVDLFGKVSSHGLDEASSEATKEVQEFKQNRATIGLNFTMSLGNTASRSEIAAATHSIKSLEAKRARIHRDYRKEIDLAFNQLEAAVKRKAQADKNIASLDRQLKAAERKFNQARAEEISAIRYEIEVLAARNSLVDAQYQARVAESRLKHALHSYPVEKAR